MSGVLVLTASKTARPLTLSGIWQIGAPGTTTAMQCRAHLLREKPTKGNGFKGLLGASRIDRVPAMNSQGVMERLSGGVTRRDLILSDSSAVSLSSIVSGDTVGLDTQCSRCSPRGSVEGQTFDPNGPRDQLRSDACHLTATSLKVGTDTRFGRAPARIGIADRLGV